MISSAARWGRYATVRERRLLQRVHGARPQRRSVPQTRRCLLTLYSSAFSGCRGALSDSRQCLKRRLSDTGEATPHARYRPATAGQGRAARRAARVGTSINPFPFLDTSEEGEAPLRWTPAAGGSNYVRMDGPCRVGRVGSKKTSRATRPSRGGRRWSIRQRRLTAWRTAAQVPSERRAAAAGAAAAGCE